MKKCLITGANSYIGTSLAKYLQSLEGYQVHCVSLRNAMWKQESFAGYDVLFHMVGKAHADVERMSSQEQKEYYAINCDLAVEAAKKAREEGVSQFVYMSSVIVYGDSAPVGRQKRITAETEPSPSNFYGDSKWRAEQQLTDLATDCFRVAIVRAPMIYGKGSKGNFPLLAKITGKISVFPAIRNERSMLYIENLTEFLRLLAESGEGGVFHPQNAEYVSTARMVQEIGAATGKTIHLWRILNPFVWLLSRIPGKFGRLADKAFGNLTIDKRLSETSFGSYTRFGLKESIGRIYEDQHHNDLL